MAPAQRLIVVLATVLAWTMAASPAQPSAATRPGPSPVLYGITIDEVGHLEEIVGSLATLPYRPTTRVYFDAQQPAQYYAPALAQIHSVSGVMGELLDSSDEKSISPTTSPRTTAATVRRSSRRCSSPSSTSRRRSPTAWTTSFSPTT